MAALSRFAPDACFVRRDGSRCLPRCGVLAALCLGWLASVAMQAQTAHFSGAVTTILYGLIEPTGAAVDGSGNVFVADTGNSTVKEILAVGGYVTVNTLAVANGNFSAPKAVAVDGSGNVFVADTGNNAVKEILAVGGYTTVKILSSGFSNITGVAVDGSENVFVADTGSGTVKEILAAGGYATVNTLAVVHGNFSQPSGVAVDGSGNVFVGDYGNSTVKEILAVGGYVTVNTLAVTNGNFIAPSGVAVDESGNIFVGDYGNSTVKEILAVGGSIPASPTIITLGSGFNNPIGVAVDGSGNVFVADTANGAVKEIMTLGVNFGTVNIASTSTALSLQFTFDTSGMIGVPAVLTQGTTGLDFADEGMGSCTTNPLSHSYNSGDTCTVNVTFTPKFAGTRYGAAELLNSSGAVIATGYVYGTGSGPQVAFLPGTQSTVASTGLSQPAGVAVDGSGNVYIADTLHNRVLMETLSGGSYTQSTVASTGLFKPSASAVDGSGNVYIADFGNNRMLKETLSGGSYTQSTLGSGLSEPWGVVVDGSGNVYIADTLNNRVLKETLSGDSYTQSIVVGTGLSSPSGVAVDGSGNVYIADTNNNRVLMETLSGGSYTQSTVGSGLNSPEGVAVDSSGNVYIADTNNNHVLKETLSGGSYTQSTLGSGLYYPCGVAVDSSGNVYIADRGNNRVLKLGVSGPPTLTFASTAVGATSSDSPQTVTLENIGNASLSFPPPGSGGNPSISTGFAIGNSSTCPQLTSISTAPTLAAGTSCTDLISFAPVEVGSISGSMVTTDNNLNATGSTQTVTLNGTATQGSQTITFTPPTSPVTYGVAPITLSATGGASGNAVIFSIVSGPGTVSGSTLTINGGGTVVVAANQAGNTNYLAATQVTQSVVVNLASQTITFTPPTTPVAYGVSPITLSATATSGLTVTFSVVSGPGTITGSTLTITGAGTVVVAANQAGNANYTAATQVTQSITVTQASQTISFTASSPVTYGAPITLSATATSGLTVTFSVVSGPGTVSGSTLTITGVGTVVVAANQAGNASYTAATQVTQSIVVNQASQTISFTASSPVTYGVAPITLSATATSSLTVTFSVVSGPGTVSGSTLTITGVGTVVVTANQAGNANYSAAAQVTQSITVTQASQTISFTALTTPVTYGVAPIALSATGGASGKAVIFSIVSGPGTISGSTLTITGVGTVVVAANQAGNANYTAAVQVTQSITVTQASQTISFTASSLVTYGVAPITLSATGGASGNAVIFSVVSGPGTVSGSTLTITGVGTVVVAANQAGNANYSAATQVTANIVVNQATQTITFTPLTTPVTYGVAPITLAAIGGASGNAVIFSVVSGPGTVSGSTLTITGAGTVVIAANQAGNANYAAATQVTQSILVNKAAPAAGVTSSVNPVLAESAITLTATVTGVSTPTGTVSFLDGTTLLGSGTLSGGVATLTTSTLAVGLHSITAVYSGDTNFVAVTSSALTESVEDFSLSSSVTSVTALPGATAVVTFTVSPVNATTLLATVTLSVSGLPTGATYSFSPAMVAAGSGTTTVTLTVQIPQTLARTQPAGGMGRSIDSSMARSTDHSTRRKLAAFALALWLLPFAGRMRRAGKKLGRLMSVLLWIGAGITATMGLSGCGFASTPYVPPPQSYTVTVTGTSGALSHSGTVTLTVQ